jgi:hypothetical protein
MIETSIVWVTKPSILSGKMHTISIDVNMESYEKYLKGEILVQEIEPLLSANDREFLLTGILPEEWDELFNEDEKD